MRCKYCGSKAIYADTNHVHATAGRVITGAIIAGAVGAAAGLAGKNIKGYRCSACGMFSEDIMPSGESLGITAAIRSAEKGERTLYEQYRQKYANLEVVPVYQTAQQESIPSPNKHYSEAIRYNKQAAEIESLNASIKHSYCPNQYVVGSPIFITNVAIKDDNGTDVLLIDINNISGKTLRSVYLTVSIYDDVGDFISTNSFAYQGLSVATGEKLPQAKPFKLNTNVAYKVDISCEKAAFSDDTVWRRDETQTFYSIPDRTELTPESFASYKYLQILLDKKNALCANQKLYYPVIEQTHRLCICGNPASSNSTCLACGLNEADLQEVLNYDNLIQCRRNIVAETAKERTNALHKIHQQVQKEKYQEATQLQKENTQAGYAAAMEILASIKGYKDAAKLYDLCSKKYEEAKEEAKKDATLADGKSKMVRQAIPYYESAIKLFESISGWKDADEQIIVCQKKIEEIKAKQEAQRLQAEIARKEAERIAKRNKKIAIITAPIVCAIITFIIVLNAVIIPNGKYNDALALMDAGKYTEAISAFEALNGYKDSTNKITECNTAILDGKYNDAIALMDAGTYSEAITDFEALDGYKDSVTKIEECNVNIYGAEVWNKIKSVNIGDTYKFGSYEQDNNKSNRQEEIEWLVLAKDGTKILVVSKYALNYKPYNTSFTSVTWATCTLREWLNNDFINEAFSADEKAMIPTVTVSADKNPEWITTPGNATQDQVFLLSITEVNKYFSSDSARQCKPTDYAVANGPYVDSDNGNCLWWLRSPGYSRNYASVVASPGFVSEWGYGSDYCAVRPALWIDLS